MLLSASQDGSVKLWDLREIPVVPRSKRGATQVSNMDYSSRTLDAGKGCVAQRGRVFPWVKRWTGGVVAVTWKVSGGKDG